MRRLWAATLLLLASPAAAATVDEFQARTFEAAEGHVLPYRLFVPPACTAPRSCGLVLFLHGIGERGSDNHRQLDQMAPLVFTQPENQRRWPVFVLAPQCPADQQWVGFDLFAPSAKGQQPAAPTWPLAAALALIDRLLAEVPALDPARVYVTGISMGGFGTWDAIVRQPKKFRAAVPICGGYDEDAVGPAVDVPLWAFHAADDPVVSVDHTRVLIAALRARGGRPLYTEYPASQGVGHFAWNPAYATPDLLPWMFERTPPADGGAPGPAGAAQAGAGGGGCALGGAPPGAGVGALAVLLALRAWRRRRRE